MSHTRPLLSTLLVVAMFSSNLLETEAAVEEVHVGCFSTDLVKSNHFFRIKTSLSWSQGLNTCVHRLATHMSITPDDRSPGDYRIFCSAGYPESESSKHYVDQSRCQRCKTNYCGGSNTVSLYKLRDSIPFMALIAVEGTGLVMYTEEDGHPRTTSLIHHHHVWDIDYLYHEDEIWFTSSNSTYRTPYVPTTSKYASPRKVPSCGHDNRSPSFDWVKKRVYYACADGNKIYELDLQGKVMKTYNPGIEQYIKKIAVDPYRKMVFIATWGYRIFSYSLETGRLKEFLDYGNLLSQGLTMCLDHHRQKLYVMGYMDGDSGLTLIRLNYEDTEADILYQGPRASYMNGIDYFDNTIIWTQGNDNNAVKVVFKCTLTPKCQKKDLKIIYKSQKNEINDVKIYHPLKQTSNNRVAVVDTAECPPLRAPSLDVRCVYQNYQTSCENEVRPGTIATPSCKQHYKLPSTHYSKHAQLTCMSQGKWSSGLIPCSAECGESAKLVVPLISFGSEAMRGQVPWQAGLYMKRLPDGTTADRWQTLCGGTLISPHIILTAAHCLKYGSENLRPVDVKVGLGKQYKDYYTKETHTIFVDVREVLVPPLYSGEATAYVQDIALLDLVTIVRITEYIMPACVDWEDIFRMTTGETVYVAGWGRTESGLASEKLLTTELTFVDNNDCLNQFSHALKRFITPDKFCGQSKKESQVQRGDSGGGMTAIKDGRHFVVGVVSTKIIEDNRFSLFTKISSPEHFNWLEQQRLRLEYFHLRSYSFFKVFFRLGAISVVFASP